MFIHPMCESVSKRTTGDNPYDERLVSGTVVAYTEEEDQNVWWNAPTRGPDVKPVTLRRVEALSMLEAHHSFKRNRTQFWNDLERGGATLVLPDVLAPSGNKFLYLSPFHRAYQGSELNGQVGHATLDMSPGYVLWCLARHCATIGEGRGMDIRITALNVDPSGRVQVEFLQGASGEYLTEDSKESEDDGDWVNKA